MAGIKIKDAPKVISVKDKDLLPISDGSEAARSVDIGLMKTHIVKEVKEQVDEAVYSEPYVPPTKP